MKGQPNMHYLSVSCFVCFDTGATAEKLMKTIPTMMALILLVLESKSPVREIFIWILCCAAVIGSVLCHPSWFVSYSLTPYSYMYISGWGVVPYPTTGNRKSRMGIKEDLENQNKCSGVWNKSFLNRPTFLVRNCRMHMEVMETGLNQEILSVLSWTSRHITIVLYIIWER